MPNINNDRSMNHSINLELEFNHSSVQYTYIIWYVYIPSVYPAMLGVVFLVYIIHHYLYHGHTYMV
jgi:hypothetical protein